MRKFFKRIKAKVLAATASLVLGMTSICGAETTLDLSGFSIEGAFATANTLLNALMPVALIAFGIGLAFVVLRFIRSLI